MVEKNLVIDGLELKYKGLFNVKELFDEIDKIIKERGYSRFEKKREERIKPTGKEFSIELRPVKQKTQFYELMVKIRINIANLQDVEVVVDDTKRQMQQGEVDIIFDAWALTDFRGRWEQTPWFYILRALFEKAFFKVRTDKYIGELIEDVHYFYNNVRSHLHMQRF